LTWSKVDCMVEVRLWHQPKRKGVRRKPAILPGSCDRVVSRLWQPGPCLTALQSRLFCGVKMSDYNKIASDAADRYRADRLGRIKTSVLRRIDIVMDSADATIDYMEKMDLQSMAVALRNTRSLLVLLHRDITEEVIR